MWKSRVNHHVNSIISLEMYVGWCYSLPRSSLGKGSAVSLEEKWKSSIRNDDVQSETI